MRTDIPIIILIVIGILIWQGSYNATECHKHTHEILELVKNE